MKTLKQAISECTDAVLELHKEKQALIREHVTSDGVSVKELQRLVNRLKKSKKEIETDQEKRVALRDSLTDSFEIARNEAIIKSNKAMLEAV